jgi:hypothetical protein
VSIFDADELELLDYVTIRTTDQGQPVTITTPNGPGTKTRILGTDGRTLNWEKRNGAGLTGATQAYRGKDLAEFSIEITMASQSEENRVAMRAAFEFWHQIVEAAPPGQPAKVYEINHPMLALAGITNCVFLNEPLVEHDDASNSDKIVYKCREWRRPLPTLSTTTAPGSNIVEGKCYDEYLDKLQARNDELEALGTQLKNLPPLFGGGGG